MKLCFVLPAVVLLLTGCSGSSGSERCDLTSSATGNFTSPNSVDLVETRAYGSECGVAVVMLSVRNHEGLPIWAWAAPLYPTFGDAFAPGTQDGSGREGVQAFLDRWAQAEFSTTQAAPAWNGELNTRLSQATFEDVRARKSPMLCFLSGAVRQMCVYWESGVGVAAPFFERDAATLSE